MLNAGEGDNVSAANPVKHSKILDVVEFTVSVLQTHHSALVWLTGVAKLLEMQQWYKSIK